MGMGPSKSLFDEALPTYTEVPGSKTEAHGFIHVADAETGYKPYMTLYTNLMERRRVDDGSRQIFGWREKDPVTGVAGPYIWVTYNEFLEQVEALSSGMVHELQTKRQEAVGVFSKNRYEWSLVEHSANRMSYQLVPLYDTLGPEAVPFILNHTEMRVIFCGKEQFKALMAAVEKSPAVKMVVQFEDVSDEDRKEAESKNLVLKSLKELMEVGKSKPVEADPPTPDDIATICYTSGTTGNPKGAMLSHGNMVSAVAATYALHPMTPEDVHLSYLPLAHVLERAVQSVVLGGGGSVGFYQGEIPKLMDDLAALQPTLFPSVPRVMNRVHDKILQGVEKAGGLKKFMFNWAYAAKKKNLAQGYIHHAFWDALVFNKIKQLMGGKVRLMMNGSAPISQDCKEFLQIVFGCPVIEGYGMTETCAIIGLSTTQFAPGTHVGLPIPGLEVCLFNVPEMNYTAEDKPCPRGEICVRGPNVFKGYYKDPEKTAEAVDADGWLHTGDIAKWNPDGTLAIIDRKKNIFKLSQGEYVAPEKIENVYLKSGLVAQIFVHGNSLQNYLVGVVVPDLEGVGEWAKANGHSSDTESLKKLVETSAELKDAIVKDMGVVAKKFGLFRFEQVAQLHLTNDTFTVENNLVTPTFKLKRPQLVERYEKEISAMYPTQAQ
ncbi:hypothetical protein Poli38472_011307 [Pythium oligandrum]|uniref:Long-chain-fatty-acid--CoA ligase n=1 Tax=Pythium oligandrum TaxID=41045 RepID=A0A8K1CQ13_PYTOL|nr:hypothetical protein Poli38472_011307 [Pythium oligandrum]|eukprot:TMW67687.1 hypothetical protein Poli38472_011307 [Pythium oligandrum]